MAQIADAVTAAYVRGKPADSAPPPALAAGPLAWMRANLFSSVPNTILTVIVTFVLVRYALIPVVEFMFIDAVWTGNDREACLPKDGREVGACWPFIWARLGYFTYGQYPFDLRWRVDLVFLLEALGIVWLLATRLPYKGLAALFFFVVFPLLAFGLLTGSSPFSFYRILPSWVLGLVVAAMLAACIVAAVRATPRPPLFYPILIVGVVVALAFLEAALAPLGTPTLLGNLLLDLQLVLFRVVAAVMPLRLFLFGAAIGLAALFFLATTAERYATLLPLIGLLLFVPFVQSLDLGWLTLRMPHVPTYLWGGVMVTMVISTIGIVVSLPFGTVLALGRRSKLPFLRFVCVLFIEIVRGVPLITMLFMANRMLPLFLSEGMQPDSLMRVIVGVALFASAYMAEVVRGGLQAIPRGQYEGAMSLGLNYPMMMIFVVLPQALKLVIPGIVNSFIGLFKDTTLVTIVGIFDFLTTIQVSINSPDWAAPSTAFTGYAFAAIFYFVCCYGMSRYSLAVERRLAAGQHR
jgi:general L-amino acid transport system permease protein